MSTIDELIPLSFLKDGKNFVQDGSFKVERTNWEGYFIPYFKAEDRWYGIGDDGKSEWYGADVESFQIYKEPKSKVKHWLWVSNNGCTSVVNGAVRFDSKCPVVGGVGDGWDKIPGSEVEI